VSDKWKEECAAAERQIAAALDAVDIEDVIVLLKNAAAHLDTAIDFSDLRNSAVDSEDD
jgi:hypothetical protein